MAVLVPAIGVLAIGRFIRGCLGMTPVQDGRSRAPAAR